MTTRKSKRLFCPKKECYDPQKNINNQFGKPLPSFSWLIEHGAVCALNFPIGMNAGLAKALGVMMKLDFERAVLNRVPRSRPTPSNISARSYSFATSISTSQRSAKATRSATRNSSASRDSRSAFRSSPRRASVRCDPRFPAKAGERFFRPSAQRFSSRCPMISPRRPRAISAGGKTNSRSVTASRKVDTTPRSAGSPARPSLTKPTSSLPRATARTATIASTTRPSWNCETPSPSSSPTTESTPRRPMFCYLKPYYNDPNESYFVQLAKGAL